MGVSWLLSTTAKALLSEAACCCQPAPLVSGIRGEPDAGAMPAMNFALSSKPAFCACAGTAATASRPANRMETRRTDVVGVILWSDFRRDWLRAGWIA